MPIRVHLCPQGRGAAAAVPGRAAGHRGEPRGLPGAPQAPPGRESGGLGRYPTLRVGLAEPAKQKSTAGLS